MQSVKQLQTADRSARASMKNAANCVNQCELQDTLIIDVSNAHGGSGLLPGPRSVEGRFHTEIRRNSTSRAVPGFFPELFLSRFRSRSFSLGGPAALERDFDAASIESLDESYAHGSTSVGLRFPFLRVLSFGSSFFDLNSSEATP